MTDEEHFFYIEKMAKTKNLLAENEYYKHTLYELKNKGNVYYIEYKTPAPTDETIETYFTAINTLEGDSLATDMDNVALVPMWKNLDNKEVKAIDFTKEMKKLEEELRAQYEKWLLFKQKKNNNTAKKKN
jgi:hypothetical protein